MLLEPSAWKLARSVLRGEGDSDVSALPDTKTDLKTIKRYKIRKGWDKVHKKYQIQFENSEWIWNNDLPTLV